MIEMLTPSPMVGSVNTVSPGSGRVTDSMDKIGKTFDQLLQDLSNTELHSDSLLTRLAAGEDVDLHEVMIAAEQTDVSFRVALAIRDRLVEAYREIMHMNI